MARTIKINGKVLRYGTKRWRIADACLDGIDWFALFQSLRPLVINQTLPWIFSANVNGSRIPKEIPEQIQELKNEIRRVYAALGREVKDFEREDDAPIPETPAEPEIEDRPKKKRTKREEEKHFFHSEWKRLRAWIAQRAESSGAVPVDTLGGMRPPEDAGKAIDQGISARMMLHAMTLHWPAITKQEAGVKTVDFHSESEDFGEGIHKLAGYVVKLAKARLPIMLIGEAGTGKGFLARQVAEYLELPFGSCPLTAGATPSWLLGRYTLRMDNGNGDGKDASYQISHFLQCFVNGGVFLFDEIDAADANMLLVVNDALALNPGQEFFNPVNGQSYIKSENFIAISAANTMGLGATSAYTGRERLDSATLDRFRMGRVVIDLDEELAFKLLMGELDSDDSSDEEGTE